MRHRILQLAFLSLALLVPLAHAGDGRMIGGAVSSGLSLGLPLGVPPAPASDQMLAVPPEDAAVFVQWSSLQASDDAGSNRTEQLLAHQEVREFIEYVRANIRRTVGAAAPNGAQALATAALDSVQTLLTSETAAYVRLDDAPAGGLVCDLGESAEAIKFSLGGAAALVGLKQSQSAGLTIYSIDEAPVPLVKLAVDDHYLIVGVGEGEFEAIRERIKQSKPAAWLVAERQRSKVKRISNLTYVNVERFDKFFADVNLGYPALKSLGADGFRSMTCVTGMSDEAVIVRSWFDTNPKLTAHLKSISGKITTADIGEVPGDATVMAALRLDLETIANDIVTSLDVIEPDATEGVERAFREEIGLDLRKDVLSCLGERILVYESPQMGGRLLTGWTAIIDIQDEAKLRKLETRLIQMVDDPRAPFAIKNRNCAGEQVSYLVFRDDAPGFTPAWCLSKGRLIVSAFPQNIYALLSQPAAMPNEKTAQAVNQQNTSIFLKVDEKRLTEMLYPFVWMVTSFLPQEVDRDLRGVLDIDPGMLPSLPAISNPLSDATVSVDFSNGLEITRHQTLPPTGITLLGSVAAFGELVEEVFDGRGNDVHVAPPVAIEGDSDSASAAPKEMNDPFEPAKMASDNDQGRQDRQLALKRALELAQQGQKKLAMEKLQKLAALERENSKDIDVRSELGKMYYSARMHKAATETYNECIEAAPNDFRGYLGRGKTTWVQDKNEESLPDLRKAAQLNPESDEPWLYQGLAHRSLGHTAESIVYLSKSLAIKPDQWFALSMRGNSYYDSKNYEKAIASYNQSLSLRKTGNRSLYWRARAHKNLGKLDSAIADATQLLQESPLDVNTLDFRGDLYEETEENALAIRDFNALIGLDPDNADAWKDRGGVWMNLDDYDNAIADYTKGIELDPDKWVFANRAICWNKKGENEKVISDYSEAIKLDPKYAFALKWRAVAYSNDKRFAESKADYTVLMSAGGEDDEVALGNYSWLLAACPDDKVRDGKLALQHGTKACEMTDWKEAWIIDNVAAAHAELGNFPKAIEFAKRAVEIAESDSERTSIAGRLQLYKQNKRAIWE